MSFNTRQSLGIHLSESVLICQANPFNFLNCLVRSIRASSLLHTLGNKPLTKLENLLLGKCTNVVLQIRNLSNFSGQCNLAFRKAFALYNSGLFERLDGNLKLRAS